MAPPRHTLPGGRASGPAKKCHRPMSRETFKKVGQRPHMHEAAGPTYPHTSWSPGQPPSIHGPVAHVAQPLPKGGPTAYTWSGSWPRVEQVLQTVGPPAPLNMGPRPMCVRQTHYVKFSETHTYEFAAHHGPHVGNELACSPTVGHLTRLLGQRPSVDGPVAPMRWKCFTWRAHGPYHTRLPN